MSWATVGWETVGWETVGWETVGWATVGWKTVDWKTLSPCLIVLGAVVLIALERRFPYEPRQRLFRVGFWTDLVGYGFVQSYFLGLCISVLIRWLDQRTGLSRLHLVSDWPVLGQLGFFFVTHDLYIYGFHRLQHRSDLLWRTHEAHHSVDDVDWLSGTRSHCFEILINQSIEFAPLVLLGAAPDVVLMKATLDALWGMFIHSNLDVRLGPLRYLFNGPELHRWHHARDLAAPGKNYATKLAIWDWLFGTAYLPEAKAARYGLPDASYPRTGPFLWFEQHAYALGFRRKPPGESSAQSLAKQ